MGNSIKKENKIRFIDNPKEYLRCYVKDRETIDPEFKERHRAATRKYYWKNKEKENARCREYYKKNKQKSIERSMKWAKEHPEQARFFIDEWEKKNKDKLNEKSRKNHQIRKLKVIEHYSNGSFKCACCGEDHFEFLTIDHINNDGSNHRKQINQSIYGWLIRNKYPLGYQVLCMNCNWAKGLFGICPHEHERINRCQ